MRKLIVITALILATGIVYGQTIRSGGLLVISKFEVTLQPDATIEQYTDWLVENYNPAAEKTYPGVKVFTLIEEGDDKDQISTLAFFESQELKEKYFPADGSLPYKEAASAILGPVNELTKEFLLDIKHESTTWVVL